MNENYYLTRGVRLKCSEGTHTRRLNIPKDHGMRIVAADQYDGHPYVTCQDCEVGDDKNICYFGICKLLTNNESLINATTASLADLSKVKSAIETTKTPDNPDSAEPSSESSVTQDTNTDSNNVDEKKKINLHAAQDTEPWEHSGCFEAEQKIEEIILIKETEEGEEESKETETGNKCCPSITLKKWENTKKETISLFNGHGSKGEEQFVTTKSYLRCKHGGVITVVSEQLSGLEYDGSKDE
ncbi:MAG: DUF4280 domain-containing protein [Lachnospiraceae bacterium]|nr:DUF4280 domain-containing protein [Lachnospiraceae bacterium]